MPPPSKLDFSSQILRLQWAWNFHEAVLALLRFCRRAKSPIWITLNWVWCLRSCIRLRPTARALNRIAQCSSYPVLRPIFSRNRQIPRCCPQSRKCLPPWCPLWKKGSTWRAASVWSRLHRFRSIIDRRKPLRFRESTALKTAPALCSIKVSPAEFPEKYGKCLAD